MKLTFRTMTSLEEALEHAPLLDRCAEEAVGDFRDDALPKDVSARFLCTHFDTPQCLLVVAEDPAGKLVGACLTGPFADPLTAEVVPMILLLHVDSDVRHRGVARALVDQIRERLAERIDTSVLAARAGHNDDALISMGERWGFVRQWEFMLIEGR